MKPLSCLTLLCGLVLALPSCGDEALDHTPSTVESTPTHAGLSQTIADDVWRDALLLLRKSQRQEAAERVAGLENHVDVRVRHLLNVDLRLAGQRVRVGEGRHGPMR